MYTKEIVKVIMSSKDIRNKFIIENFPEYCRTISRGKNKGLLEFDEKKGGDNIDLIVSLLNERKENVDIFCNFSRKEVLQKGGRFFLISKMYDHYVNLEKELKEELDKLGGDNYLPDAFEDQIIKPWFRSVLNEGLSIEEINLSYENNIKNKAKAVALSRSLKQIKNDLAEYHLFTKTNGKFISSIKHGKNQKADGLYLDKEGNLNDLNIKTSRWPDFFYNGITAEVAARKLYENQSEKWFQADSRTYLISPSLNGKKPGETLSLEEQLDRNLDELKFMYKKKEYVVSSVKIIFLD